MKTFPRDCGQRLLSHVIDERASNNHKRPFAAIPKTSNPGDGYRDISYTTFANAINRLAQWLLAELGPPVSKHESVVYIAAPDLRYHILCMAAVKAGYVIFLVSPRNSHEAFASLMEECEATRLLTDEKRLPAVASIQRARHMQTSAIPLLDELLDPRPVPSIELLATWEEYRFVPFVQIHSSGSTGIPKLVTINHGSITGFDAYQLLDEAEVLERLGDERIFVSFPPFHIAGIMYGLTAPCWFDSTVVLPPSVPLTADLVNEIHLQANVDYSALAPSVVTDLAKNPVYLENISRLKGLAFAGGPLSESTGKLVAERTNMNAGYGASEWIVAPQLPKAREDWAYFCFNEKQGGYEFRERDQGLYELCIVRKAEYHLFQPVFVNFPDIDEFCSKDLFTKHPTKPGLWKYASRFDDIIVFSNGEKLNPVTFESLVTTSPHVKGCIVIGQGRFQATLLVELADAEERQPLDKIWPIVERANEPTVKHGRITKDHILFTTLDKPLPRAGKGTVQRAAANKLYASEIDEHYANIDKKRQPSEKCPFLALGTIAEAKQSLAEYFNKELGTNEVTNSTDLFSLGLDSLQVINLVRAINSSRPDLAIDAKLVYDYPTIDKLSSVLLRGNNEHYDYSNDSDDEELKESWLAMDDMYEDLTARMNAPASNKRRKRKSPSAWLKSDNATVKPVVQPDGGSIAWLQVLSMFLVNVNNWGLVNSFGVFQAYYQEDLLSQHSASSIAWIGTLQGALLLIVGVISGPLFDKGYFKHMLIVGGVGMVFALMMLSLSTEYYQVLLSQGILLGVCEGLLYIPSVALVPVYFKKNRGLALGLSTGGGSIGGVIYPAIFYRLLQSVGFGWAVRIIGFIALVTLGIAVALSKPLSSRTSRQLLDMSALRDVSYLTFLGSAFFLLAGMFVPFFLATTYTTTSLHSTTSLGFYLISVVNAAQFFGRVLPSWSTDFKHKYFGPEALQFLGELALGILGFCWIAVGNIGGYIPWLIIYGFFSGFAITLPAIVLPYICPNMAVYGTRIGMLYACAGIGFLISTPIASAANTATSSFLGSQLWVGATCTAASVFFLFTAIQARKQRLLYEMGKRSRKERKSRRPRNSEKV